MTKEKKNGSLTSRISLIIAAIALIISIRSCYRAEKSFDLTTENFMSERMVNWAGEIDNDANTLKLISLNNEAYLQQAKIYFPPQLDSTASFIEPPNYILPLTPLEFKLENFIGENVTLEDSIVVISERQAVPIVIHSNYTAKGRLVQDLSLYYLSLSFMGNKQNYKQFDVSFKGIHFSNRIDFKQDPYQILRDEWEKLSKAN